MQAIHTKFLPPANVRGSRVKATAQAGSLTLHWDHALNADDNHTAAARAFATKYGWAGRWYGGTLPDGSSVFVCADPHYTVGSFTIEREAA